VRMQRVFGKPSTLKNLGLTACSLLALFTTSTVASAQGVRTGSTAYGDWRMDAPGVMRKITPADMPAPLASPSTANRSKVVLKPAGAELRTIPGDYQDFVVGFVANDQDVWGRPVDVAFAKDGSLLFSDDGNGVVYRVAYKGE
jgi:hypothetical protein